jgi:Zn ribbon nucleic-acid-binding protein
MACYCSKVQCPLCRADGVKAFQANRIQLEDCPSCGHRFAAYDARIDHISTQYKDSYFFEGGLGYSGYLADSKLILRHGQRYAKHLHN